MKVGREAVFLEQAAETIGEPLFGASNGPTGGPTPVTLTSRLALGISMGDLRATFGRARYFGSCIVIIFQSSEE